MSTWQQRDAERQETPQRGVSRAKWVVKRRSDCLSFIGESSARCRNTSARPAAVCSVPPGSGRGAPPCPREHRPLGARSLPRGCPHSCVLLAGYSLLPGSFATGTLLSCWKAWKGQGMPGRPWGRGEPCPELAAGLPWIDPISSKPQSVSLNT